ncbi:MAG: hypothetical protein M3P20_03490 [Thermoproteota archaeon]|nr:hypothetical protein [Thermoproteota archaeon]
MSSCNTGPLFGPHIMVVGLMDIRNSAKTIPATVAAANTTIESRNLVLIFNGIVVPEMVKQPALYLSSSYVMQDQYKNSQSNRKINRYQHFRGFYPLWLREPNEEFYERYRNVNWKGSVKLAECCSDVLPLQILDEVKH